MFLCVQAHRSHADLRSGMSTPTSAMLSHYHGDFYQELYARYPQAFRRRLEARENGRQLFNARNEIKGQRHGLNNSYKGQGQSYLGQGHSSGSLSARVFSTDDVNRDHFYTMQGQRSRSKSGDHVTFADEESDLSNLTVKQRLRLNTQHLNKLLNEQSPFLKRHNIERLDSDDELGKEQTLRDYMLERNKERSRHRKKHQRIILQRKIAKCESSENKENDFVHRRWISKSVSPVSRHRPGFKAPELELAQDSHHVDVDALLADSDLKIDTLLDKITVGMMSPNALSEKKVHGHDKGSYSEDNKEELHSPGGCETEEFSGEIIRGTESESSPGSSVSASGNVNGLKTHENISRNDRSIVRVSNSDIDEMHLPSDITAGRKTKTPDVTSETAACNCAIHGGKQTEGPDSPAICKCEHSEIPNSTVGLLQICSNGLSNGTHQDIMHPHEIGDHRFKSEPDNGQSETNGNLNEVTHLQGILKSDSAQMPGLPVSNCVSAKSDLVHANDAKGEGTEGANLEFAENCYQADDEREFEETGAIVTDMENRTQAKVTVHKGELSVVFVCGY